MAFDAMTFINNYMQSSGAPSKRSVKNKSGRAGRKAYNGRQTLARVGGVSSTMAAIYAPADRNLCVVVPHDVGWKANGDPNRL